VALEQLRERLSDKCVAVEIRSAARAISRRRDLVHMVAYMHATTPPATTVVPIPDEMQQLADEYHDKLMDVVAETSDELMERYLEGGEITREEMAQALKQLVTDGQVFPSLGAATRTSLAWAARPDREGLPSPVRAATCRERGASTLRIRVQDHRRPYSGKISLLRVFAGTLRADAQRSQPTHGKERIGPLLMVQGKDHTPTDELGPA